MLTFEPCNWFELGMLEGCVENISNGRTMLFDSIEFGLLGRPNTWIALCDDHMLR